MLWCAHTGVDRPSKRRSQYSVGMWAGRTSKILPAPPVRPGADVPGHIEDWTFAHAKASRVRFSGA